MSYLNPQSSPTASTAVKRDASGNLFADAFIGSQASTATSGGTTTLTADSAAVQAFTGSSSHSLNLPSTGIVAGQWFLVINNSTSYVAVYPSSGGGGLTTVDAGKMAFFYAKTAAPTANGDWQILAPNTAAGVYTLVQRDQYANVTADNFIANVSSIATAAGTTTMTIDSKQTQVFTGSTTQTVKLPTTSVTAGMEFRIINQSTGDVTVQSSGANTIATLTGAADPSMKVFIALKDTPTTDKHWRAV